MNAMNKTMKEAVVIARILNKAIAQVAKAENSAWQNVSARVLTVTIPSSADLAGVKATFDQLSELVDGVSKKTWQTSYKSILFAIAKQYHAGRIDTDGVKALSGKSIGELKKVVGWGPKPKPEAPKTEAPKGNTDAVAPTTLPPIGKATKEVKTVNDLYDAVLPSLEISRDALIKFSGSGNKVSKKQVSALADLAKSINDALNALSVLID